MIQGWLPRPVGDDVLSHSEAQTKKKPSQKNACSGVGRKVRFFESDPIILGGELMRRMNEAWADWVVTGEREREDELR